MLSTNTTRDTELNAVQIQGESYYKISNSDALRPFFMSIVSDSNHWMFISSNGGLSAGRKDSDNAIFPYYTDDKITESADITGSKSMFQVQKDGISHLWEPFSDRLAGKYRITRNLYKHVYGNKVIFEEENHDLKLTFRYAWNSSDKYGFVKKSTLSNNSLGEVQVSILDGIQNIVPCGVGSDLQNRSSNLVDAYKRSELQKETGLGIFALSAIIVDKAEPSEALKANIVWSIGMDQPTYLLSSLQLDRFRKGFTIEEEVDVKAEKGAYFIQTTEILEPSGAKDWMILADVNKDHGDVARLSKSLGEDDDLVEKINLDIDAGTKHLLELNAAADGLQLTSDGFRDTRHFSNVLFNIMRGGIFDNNYQISKNDLHSYIAHANKQVFDKTVAILNDLPETFPFSTLKKVAQSQDNVDFERLCMEYLPLTFSRRHGDPSRPWNRFSINTRSEVDGSTILDYEGNWRDIFQNWEALAYAYPEFMEGMIHKFLNASTFDGYNPYRVTKDGFDWEAIEPDDPWSYIGYWGDHQIIYLLKFLEFQEKHNPGKLESYFGKEYFVYANVPYRIKTHEDILKNPKDTIDFDDKLDHIIQQEREKFGADAALIKDQSGSIYRVDFMEKILATLLAKLSNFIPEGGIWMNTQRPEWNDANNALVGNGVSMVTLYYLNRFLKFFQTLLADSEVADVAISKELAECYRRIFKTFEAHQGILQGTVSDSDRMRVLDELGKAGSDYRNHIYEQPFSGEKSTESIEDLKRFIDLGLTYLEHTIKANKRNDDLYHAYNLMTVENEQEVSISYLSEMLEGQVAVLSSGYLSPEEVVSVLDGLKNSALFREDQYSYLLYPNKDLPGFFNKNIIPGESVDSSELLTQLVKDGDTHIIERDVNGVYHFNGNFRNENDVREGLEALSTTGYAPLVAKAQEHVLQVFEDAFNHKAFTGRSGTFFGYEGLGSIYWHMVSKLQLAVMECCVQAIESNASEDIVGRMLEHYYEINEGIGVHKSPALYGAFPTDPYSHTPAGKGAQQPGMTGQVKEDILSRFGELGVFVRDGKIHFNPSLLRKSEFLDEGGSFEYVDIHQHHKQMAVEANGLCFTYCQIPIVYVLSADERIEVMMEDGSSQSFDSLSLNEQVSQHMFERTGKVASVNVYVHANRLK